MTGVQTLSLYFHTLRHLRARQVLNRLWRGVQPARPVDGPALPLRAVEGYWQRPVFRRSSLVGQDEFVFLNERHRIETADDWNSPCRSRLWLYNAHYFDDLVAEGSAARRSWHYELIERWIDENPPGAGCGWEPYPSSLRIVNWIRLHLGGNPLMEKALSSMAAQVRMLRGQLEFHLMGNHLLANAKALVFAGLFFEGDEAEEWLAKGRRLVDREIAEQILPDGGHFERSPMYHLIVLEDVLDLINVCGTYECEIPDSWLDVAKRMLDWAQVMQHPDGDIPFFNDAAVGVAARPKELAAYAGRIGVESGPRETESMWAGLDSGYVKVTAGPVTAFFDVAPIGPDHLPGHGHADTLSVEASIHAQRVLVNSGISTYEPGPERELERGTNAHNTITVDDQNSSEVWGGFRVARRARVHDVQVEPGSGKARAWHGGFSRLPGRPRHLRSIAVSKQGLCVEDQVTGGGVHAVELRWHLHPDVEITDVEDGATKQIRLIQLHAPDGAKSCVLKMTIEGPGALAVEESTYHPSFGVSLSTSCVVLRYRGSLPVATVTRLS